MATIIERAEPSSGESGTKFEPVLAGEYISERAAMHRLDYTEGRTEGELEQLSAEIRLSGVNARVASAVECIEDLTNRLAQLLGSGSL